MYQMKKKKKRVMPMKEVLVLYHSLDIERKELKNIQEKIEVILFVKEQLTRMGLETKNIDVLLSQIEKEQAFSKETIHMLNNMIPEKVDSQVLQKAVNHYLTYEEMNFHELARALGIPYLEFEMFMKTGNADNYVIMKIFEYFQSQPSN